MHTKSITMLGHLINKTYIRSFPCIRHSKQMHSALFQRGDLCTNQCRRKSCLYLHRNCSRTVCPCETITSVPSLSPPTPPRPRPGTAKAIWPRGWNYTSAARLDATGLFAQWLWALFSFFLLPGCSLPPLILSWAQIAMGAPSFSKRLKKPPGAENGLLERSGSV